MSVIGPSRQAAFFGPTVANGALRTLLDLQLAPAQSRMLRVSDAGRSRRRGVHRGRRPKAFNERNRGKWQAVVSRALWGFARGRRTGCWQPTPMSALVDDVAAHERGAACVSVRLEQ